MEEEPVVTFQEQDFGELSPTIRANTATASDVECLIPDDGESHIEALRGIRAIIENYYGDRIAELAGPGEEVIITRVTMPSDDLPQIEYTIVPEK